jgi:hypothetical protein
MRAATRRRLARLEMDVERLSKAKPAGEPSKLFELLKTALGSWPLFAAVLLLLFHGPVRDIIAALPAKLKDANEVQIAGVTLKMAIEREAAKVGATSLSTTIPSLSSDALTALLRTPMQGGSLVSFNPNRQDDLLSITFPAPNVVAALDELREKGLLNLILHHPSKPETSITGREFSAIVQGLRDANPGVLQPAGREEELTWLPSKPIPRAQLPVLTTRLTPQGQKAVTIIVNSVALQLATPPKLSK